MTTILHTTDAAAGIAAAIASYVRNTPELEHHLVYLDRGERASAVPFGIDADRMVTVHGLAELRRTLQSTVSELRPAVLHAHSSRAGVVARSLPVRARAASTLLYSPHCFAFERQDVSAAVRAAFYLVERTFASRADGILACSHRELRSATTLAPRGRHALVPNVASAVPEAMPMEREPGLVVAVGRIAPQKDPQYFAQLIERTRRRVPETRGVWVGSGTASDVAALESAGIAVTGWLPRTETARWLARAQVYVNSSRWEGFPVALLEAVGAGCPAVVRNIPAFADLPPDVRFGNVPDASVRVGALLRSGSERERNRTHWAQITAGNTDVAQRRALLVAYGMGAAA